MRIDHKGQVGLFDGRWTLLGYYGFCANRHLILVHRVAALVSELRNDLHLGCGEIGLLLASFMIAGVLLSLPSCMVFGRLEDRVTLLCGLRTLILSGAALAQSTEFMGALVGRFDVVAGFETYGLTGAVYLTVPLPAVAAITVMMAPLGSVDAVPDTTIGTKLSCGPFPDINFGSSLSPDSRGRWWVPAAMLYFPSTP